MLKVLCEVHKGHIFICIKYNYRNIICKKLSGKGIILKY